MINGIGSSLSGLSANTKKMGVSANNVANINTGDFKKSRTVFKADAHGEVAVDIQKIETPGNPISYEEGEKKIHKETSNVDYAEEAVNMITAQKGFKANLMVIKTQAEMLGSILDIIA